MTEQNMIADRLTGLGYTFKECDDGIIRFGVPYRNPIGTLGVAQLELRALHDDPRGDVHMIVLPGSLDYEARKASPAVFPRSSMIPMGVFKDDDITIIIDSLFVRNVPEIGDAQMPRLQGWCHVEELHTLLNMALEGMAFVFGAIHHESNNKTEQID